MPNGTEFSRVENIFFPTVFRSEQERLRAFPEVETLCGEFLSNKNYTSSEVSNNSNEESVPFVKTTLKPSALAI